MKTIQRLVALGIAGGLLMSGQVAKAQDATDVLALLQKTRSVTSNNASIDEANPETVDFQTVMESQLVEINLKANRLNDAFISAINYSADNPTGLWTRVKRFFQAEPNNVTFGDLRIILDGCDVTTEVIAQCNANDCWDTDPLVDRTSLSATFGTAIYVNLSALNPRLITGCLAAPGSTTFFDLAHRDHRLEFREGTTGQSKAGSLSYQVIVYHRVY